MDVTPPLILASSSPRRRMLLQDAGYQFTVDPPDNDVEDGRRDQETPAKFVMRMARQKAETVAHRYTAAIVLGCDTVALFQNQIIGKPDDRDSAQQMLRLLRGAQHRVLSGICLWHRPGDRVVQQCVSTTLYLEPVSDQQIQHYLDTNKWQGKAGAFGYQDGWDWIQILHGSPSNVVGLPLETLHQLLPAQPE